MADRVPNNRKPVIRPGKPSFAGARKMTRQGLYDHIQAFQKVAPSTAAVTQAATPIAISAPASTGTGGAPGSSVTLSNLAPAALTVGGTADPGTSGQVSRSDHAHAMPAVFGPAGGSHAAGFAPDPGSSSHSTAPYYLGDDGNYHQILGSGITTAWAASGAGALTFGLTLTPVYAELPSGTINGVNKTFTLANAPSPAASLAIYLQPTGSTGGLRQEITVQYTLSTNTITFVTAPPIGAIILCDYTH